jgi:hypothetical protein
LKRVAGIEFIRAPNNVTRKIGCHSDKHIPRCSEVPSLLNQPGGVVPPVRNPVGTTPADQPPEFCKCGSVLASSLRAMISKYDE